MLKPAGWKAPAVNAIVLCGGKSSRMGSDKAFLKAGGRALETSGLGWPETGFLRGSYEVVEEGGNQIV